MILTAGSGRQDESVCKVDWRTGRKGDHRDDCKELGKVGPVGREGLVQSYLLFSRQDYSYFSLMKRPRNPDKKSGAGVVAGQSLRSLLFGRIPPLEGRRKQKK